MIPVGAKKQRSTRALRKRARLLNAVYKLENPDFRHAQARAEQAWTRLDGNVCLLVEALKRIRNGALTARIEQTLNINCEPQNYVI